MTEKLRRITPDDLDGLLPPWPVVLQEIPPQANYVYIGYSGKNLIWSEHEPVYDSGHRILAGRGPRGRPCSHPIDTVDRMLDCDFFDPAGAPAIVWERIQREWWKQTGQMQDLKMTNSSSDRERV